MTTVERLDTDPGRDGSGAPGGDRTHRSAALIRVLECGRPMAAASRVMLDGLDELVVGRGAVDQLQRGGRWAQLVVADAETSRQHFAIRRGAPGWDVFDLDSKNGTFLNGERIAVAPLADGDLVEAGGALLVFRDVPGPRRGARDRELAGDAGGPRAWQTLSIELEQRFEQVAKIASTMVPVLVRGETGTGKEVMARAIHDASGRRGPFVAVNCGALPRHLIESELFGHRRGAFTGATDDREGLVRRAHHGTLFLDEIAELPPESQVALLRVLQEGEIRPVGASEDVKIDVRVVAATHQDLARRIEAGLFRPDLYGRISGFEVTMPPLRERREDLGVLIAAILARTCSPSRRVTLSKPAARALLGYHWPLNIRELEQALRAAVALAEGGELGLAQLPEAVRSRDEPAACMLGPQDRALRARLVELLRGESGNVAAVGRAMDRAPIQVRRWCHRLGIDLAVFRD